MGAAMSHVVFDNKSVDFILDEDYRPSMTMTQLMSLVRQSTVEFTLDPTKPFTYHLFENLYMFDKEKAIDFLVSGVDDVFFEAQREKVLALVGKFFLGDVTKRKM